MHPRGAYYAIPNFELPPGKTDVDYDLGMKRANVDLTDFGSGFVKAQDMGALRYVFLDPP